MRLTPSRPAAAAPQEATSSVPYTALSADTALAAEAALPTEGALPAATAEAYTRSSDDAGRPNSGAATVVAAAAVEKSSQPNVPVSYGDVATPVAVNVAPTAVVVNDAAAVVEAAPAVQPVEQTATQAAPASPAHSPELDSFTTSVENGKADQVVGVFVQNEFALPVVQQPDGDVNYVAVQDNTVTQFASPSMYGTIGLLAHNFLSGKYFFNLKQSDDVYVVYGDGRQEEYRVSQIQRYQALDPSNPYSYFVDTTDPNHTSMTAGALFNKIYTKPDQVVLQTCIEANGDSSWGRIFITATKVQ